MTKEKRLMLLKAMVNPDGITEMSDGWFEIRREDGHGSYLVRDDGKVDRPKDLHDVDEAINMRVFSHYRYLESLFSTTEKRER